MTPNWLKAYLKDEKLSESRVEVAWEGTHVALIKKLRPVRWQVIDKEYNADASVARSEYFEGKLMLDGNLLTGRVSPPDYVRLLARVGKLDQDYPRLLAEQEDKRARYRKRVEAEQRKAERQRKAAKTRANDLARVLKRAGLPFTTGEVTYYGDYKLAKFEIELPNGLVLNVGSNLQGFAIAPVQLDAHTDSAVAVVRIANAVGKLRIPKE